MRQSPCRLSKACGHQRQRPSNGFVRDAPMIGISTLAPTDAPQDSGVAADMGTDANALIGLAKGSLSWTEDEEPDRKVAPSSRASCFHHLAIPAGRGSRRGSPRAETLRPRCQQASTASRAHRVETRVCSRISGSARPLWSVARGSVASRAPRLSRRVGRTRWRGFKANIADAEGRTKAGARTAASVTPLADMALAKRLSGDHPGCPRRARQTPRSTAAIAIAATAIPRLRPRALGAPGTMQMNGGMPGCETRARSPSKKFADA